MTPFNPIDTAAMVKPHKKKVLNPVEMAAMPDLTKKKPVILPPKKAPLKHGEVKVTTSDGFPKPGDPYWKDHPIITEHSDGTVRRWGDDTTNRKNPNTLPTQMMPPSGVPTGKPQLDLSDKAKGYSSYYYRKNQ
jgi:hypothetical protein